MFLPRHYASLARSAIWHIPIYLPKVQSFQLTFGHAKTRYTGRASHTEHSTLLPSLHIWPGMLVGSVARNMTCSHLSRQHDALLAVPSISTRDVTTQPAQISRSRPTPTAHPNLLNVRHAKRQEEHRELGANRAAEKEVKTLHFANGETMDMMSVYSRSVRLPASEYRSIHLCYVATALRTMIHSLHQ